MMSAVQFYLLCWGVLMIVAIINGVLRVYTYGKVLPEIRAHQLSSITGIVLVTLVVRALFEIKPIQSAKEALLIGLMWLLMTCAFEFGFGHYVMKHSWEKIVSDYRIDRGRLWLLFLLWIAAVPAILFYYL